MSVKEKNQRLCQGFWLRSLELPFIDDIGKNFVETISVCVCWGDRALFGTC